jgi:hypothetical protein
VAENREPFYAAVHHQRRYLLGQALAGVFAILSVLVAVLLSVLAALESEVCFMDFILHRVVYRLWQHCLGVLRKIMPDVVTRTVRPSFCDLSISVQIFYRFS